MRQALDSSASPAGQAVPFKPNSRMRTRLRNSLAAYAFLSPYLLVLTVFTVIAVFYAFYLSFFYVNIGFTDPIWYGLKNYQNIWYDFTHNGNFIVSIVNVIWYAIFVVSLQTILALLMANLINAKIRAKPLFRTTFYLPALTSSVAISLIFYWLLKPTGGVNFLLSLLHLPQPNWLSDPNGIFSHFFNTDNLPYVFSGPSTSLIAIVMLNIWTTAPTFMLIYLAALQEIPDSVYEAARIDGASGWQTLTRITVPLLRPTTFLVVALGTIGAFQVFDQVFVIQGPACGPLRSTCTPALEIYNTAFYNSLTGLACAQAVILFVIIFTLTVLQRRFIDTSVQY